MIEIDEYYFLDLKELVENNESNTGLNFDVSKVTEKFEKISQIICESDFFMMYNLKNEKNSKKNNEIKKVIESVEKMSVLSDYLPEIIEKDSTKNMHTKNTQIDDGTNKVDSTLYKLAHSEGFEWTRWSHDGSQFNIEQEFNTFKKEYDRFKVKKLEIKPRILDKKNREDFIRKIHAYFNHKSIGRQFIDTKNNPPNCRSMISPDF